MKILIILGLLLLNINCFAKVNPGESIAAKEINASMFHIGSIQTSLLTLAQFQVQTGDCWVKINGQNVSGSDYSVITGLNSLPLGEGRFLRNIGGVPLYWVKLKMIKFKAINMYLVA